jgi:hypothetical protein
VRWKCSIPLRTFAEFLDFEGEGLSGWALIGVRPFVSAVIDRRYSALKNQSISPLQNDFGVLLIPGYG